MDNKNVYILHPDELVEAVNQESGQTAEMLRQQCTTLEMLDGNMLMSFAVNSELFAGMLDELALQSSFMNSQLGEQQIYDATALEGASAMYLLVNTLSGNVEGMLQEMIKLGSYGNAVSGDVGKMAPLLDQMANSGSTANDAANTAFGAVGALGSLESAGQAFGNIAGIGGMLASLGPIMTTVAPLLIGGLAVAGIGGLIFSAFKNKNDKKEDAETTANTTTNAPTTDTTKTTTGGNSNEEIDTSQALVDPYNTGKGEESAYNQYQSQIDSSHATAEALRNAVQTGNAAVAEQLGEVADMLKKLAEKPADRNVNSSIVIETLQTTATLQQFTRMLETVLKDGLQTAT